MAKKNHKSVKNHCVQIMIKKIQKIEIFSGSLNMVIIIMILLLQIIIMRKIATGNHNDNSSGSNEDDKDTCMSKDTFLEHWCNVYY